MQAYLQAAGFNVPIFYLRSNVAYLALLYKNFDRVQALLYRYEKVEAVGEIDVDPISFQPRSR
jgi:hypothetical protein